MKRLIVLPVAILATCAAATAQTKGTYANPPTAVPIMVAIEPTPLTGADFRALFGSTKSDQILDKLPLESVSLNTLAVEGSGNISYLAANVAASGESVVVKQDYVKYINWKDAAGKQFRVGIGVRIKANAATKSGSVNLGGLFGVGASSAASKVNGSLQLDVIGISGPVVTGAFPVQNQLTPENILNAVQTAVTVRSHVWDGYKRVATGGGTGGGGAGASATATDPRVQPVTITPQIIAMQVDAIPQPKGRLTIPANSLQYQPTTAAGQSAPPPVKLSVF